MNALDNVCVFGVAVTSWNGAALCARWTPRRRTSVAWDNAHPRRQTVPQLATGVAHTRLAGNTLRLGKINVTVANLPVIASFGVDEGGRVRLRRDCSGPGTRFVMTAVTWFASRGIGSAAGVRSRYELDSPRRRMLPSLNPNRGLTMEAWLRPSGAFGPFRVLMT